MSSVGGFVVEDAIHGFDKAPSFFFGNRKREGMYVDAVRIFGFWGGLGVGLRLCLLGRIDVGLCLMDGDRK